MNLNEVIEKNEYTVILCLGDSITEANHCSEGHPGYVALLDETLRLTHGRSRFLVINAGVGGRKLSDSVPLLQGLVERFRPAVTTVMFGMNDCANGAAGKDNFTSGMMQLLDFLRIKNSDAVLLTQNPIDYRCDIDSIQRRPDLPAYMDAVRDCARRTGTDLVDINAAWQREVLDVSNNEHFKLLHDAIHPNQHGHRFIFRQIEKTLLA